MQRGLLVEYYADLAQKQMLEFDEIAYGVGGVELLQTEKVPVRSRRLCSSH